jgi:1-deoxy-D-xylulose-5-phosphate reductoisomerase
MTLQEFIQEIPAGSLSLFADAGNEAIHVNGASIPLASVMVAKRFFDRPGNMLVVAKDFKSAEVWMENLQSLVGEDMNEVDKILLTASGGPFRTKTMEEIARVTKADALRHPTWDMGAKITIDSASMMNKGFEVIEAKWLFGVGADRIQVLVHPQSIVHSAVQFVDGSVKAQLGVPDMRLPIQYAFSYPERLPLSGERLDLFRAQKLEFFEPDLEKFRCLAMAYEAIRRGGNMACIVNAANEVVNRAFLEDRCGFLQMGDVIAETMERATFVKTPTLDDYFETDREARKIAEKILMNNA